MKNLSLKKKMYDWRLKRSREINRLTIEAHEYAWEKNLLRNSKKKIFQTAKSIEQIVAKHKNVSRIYILGAGFSLEKNKEQFKKMYEQESGIVFCVDASLRYVVFEIGIIPDYVFVLDSKKMGLRFFKDISDEQYKKMKIVISSAVDKEFLPVIEKFGEIYGFHMYDPSLPVWGGDSPNVAHKLLPNLNYILNKGNVFNLALQVAINCEPKELVYFGCEYCYLPDENGNLRTRAKVNDGIDYSIGGEFARYDKIIVAEFNNRLFMTQGDYYNYALISNEIIASSPQIKHINFSGGLLNA